MQEVLSLIKEKKLIEKGDIVGVGVSGGMDSMALLNVLLSFKDEIGFDIIAINVNHLIRDNSDDDTQFVINYCKEHDIKIHSFKVDALKFSEENKISTELGARQLRYGVFDALLKKSIVNKIALAHHENDQAETILMNLFRGTGVRGIQGMEYDRKDGYIRPFLDTPKQKIIEYIKKNNIPYVTDQTNFDSTYHRNFLRNEVMPLILQKWPNAIHSLTNFAKDCVEDDKYIRRHMVLDAILFEEKMAKVPTSYFLQDESLVSRIIFEVLRKIGVTKDIERKHIEMITALALGGENGSKIDLPYDLKVIREYDYITFVNKQKNIVPLNIPFKAGKFKVENFGEFKISKVDKLNFVKNETNLLVDGDKLPKDATWRFKQDGDMFKKFGGGTKKLKSYLVDKKIPSRIRETLPVLASGSEIFAILGVEISDLVKADDTSKHCFEITILNENEKNK